MAILDPSHATPRFALLLDSLGANVSGQDFATKYL
jgi:hypothetical protein